jgi:RNA polymerase sigma-70 factor (ECF subfamily)
MKHLSDIEIIESVKRGNQGDFALLIDRYKDKAFNLLKRMLKNDQDAEEVLQDAFLKAFNSLHSFRQEAKFSTWFYKIAYNSALTELSKKKRKIEREMSSIEDQLELGIDDDEIYSRTNGANEYLYKIFDQLPVKHALVVILFYIDNMSLNEISQVTGQSIVNIKVMLHRSRNSLRELLLKHNYHEELL